MIKLVIAIQLTPRVFVFFFQAEDGIRDSVASRGLGDVYKRQDLNSIIAMEQKMSTLNIGYDLDDAGDDDEKVGESSPAVDATPVATVEGEQSSPSKNALLTFGMDGEETVENPVSSFF